MKEERKENEYHRCTDCGEEIRDGHQWYCNKGRMRYKDTKTKKIYSCYGAQ